MTGVSRLKRHLALESVARSDERDVYGAVAEQVIDLVERDGRWPLAMHDPLGKVLEEIHAPPLLDEFRVHEIEAAVVSDHGELSAGSLGRHPRSHGPS